MNQQQTEPYLVRIAELEIDPVHLVAYRAMLTAEIEASLQREDGVLAIQAVALPDNPNHLRIFEVYASERSYQDHLRTPHFLAYKAGTADMVQSLRLIDVQPVRLRSRPLDL